MGRYRQREPFHFGIDYFKAYVKKDKYRKSKLDGLSANSNIWRFDSETEILFRPDFASGKYSKYFEIRDLPTGAILAFMMLGKRDKTGSVDRKDIFEVSGQGLILRRIEWYIKLIDIFGYTIEGFKRVDLCLDILINTDYVVRDILIPAVKDKTHKPHCNKGTYTGIDIGERNPFKNTWKFIRVYDKIEDTREKGKEFLYNFKEKGIKELTRFEIELRRDKCKHFRVEYLTDTAMLYKIFNHEVFGLNWQFFKFIHGSDAEKVAYSYLIEPFSEKGFFNLTAGEAKAKALELQERELKFGKNFRNDTEKRKAIAIFLAYFRKLVGNGIEYEEILSLIDAENDRLLPFHIDSVV